MTFKGQMIDSDQIWTSLTRAFSFSINSTVIFPQPSEDFAALRNIELQFKIHDKGQEVQNSLFNDVISAKNLPFNELSSWVKLHHFRVLMLKLPTFAVAKGCSGSAAREQCILID